MDSALSTSSGPADLRHGARTHLFVIATLCWDAGSTPVHVRNMSANGALIEGAILPKPGSPFVLKRGSLQVGGRIAWAASRQAGLAFSATVSVADWMARQANARQDQIDEIVSALKSAPIGEQHPSSPVLGSDTCVDRDGACPASRRFDATRKRACRGRGARRNAPGNSIARHRIAAHRTDHGRDPLGRLFRMISRF